MSKELKEKIDKMLSDALFEASVDRPEEYNKLWEMQEILDSISTIN